MKNKRTKRMTAMYKQTRSIVKEIVAKALTKAFGIIGIKTPEKKQMQEKEHTKKNENSMGKRKS